MVLSRAVTPGIPPLFVLYSLLKGAVICICNFESLFLPWVECLREEWCNYHAAQNNRQWILKSLAQILDRQLLSQTCFRVCGRLFMPVLWSPRFIALFRFLAISKRGFFPPSLLHSKGLVLCIEVVGGFSFSSSSLSWPSFASLSSFFPHFFFFFCLSQSLLAEADAEIVISSAYNAELCKNLSLSHLE